MNAEINQKDYQLGIYHERARVSSILAEMIFETGGQVRSAHSEGTRNRFLDLLELLHRINMRVVGDEYQTDPDKWEL